VTDLQRFFRQLVRNLAATDPARLRRPLPLPDIRDSIVPYRANRRALQLESSEDYELVLMQLCAGEGGLAKTEPEDVRALFAAELQSKNPDLGILHLHENAVVSLEADALTEALDPEPELAFAPPGHRAAKVTDKSVAALPELSPSEPIVPDSGLEPRRGIPAVYCAQCGGLLPTGRQANFCPHCGSNQSHARCPACEREIEAGWRHCVSCGAAVSGD
jgi:hypothetical protein